MCVRMGLGLGSGLGVVLMKALQFLSLVLSFLGAIQLTPVLCVYSIEIFSHLSIDLEIK